MTPCPVCGHWHVCEDLGAAGRSARSAVPGFAQAVDSGVAQHRFAHGARATGTMPPATIYVENNVLAACNGAYDRAELVRGDEVRLADLLFVLAATANLEAWLAAYDIDRELLRIELDTLEQTAPARGHSLDPPATSAAMRNVLRRARDGSARRESASVGIGDLLLAVIAATDDTAGRLLADHVARQRRRRGLRPAPGREQGGASALGLNDPFPPFAPVLPMNKDPAVFEDEAGRQTPDAWSRATGAARPSMRAVADGFWDTDHAASDTVTRNADAGFAATTQVTASAGLDDLYRPGEREPVDGRHRAPAWLDGDGQARAWPDPTARRASAAASDEILRQMSRQLADVREQFATRLDEQDTQLESIAERLDELAEGWETPLPSTGAEGAVTGMALVSTHAIPAPRAHEAMTSGAHASDALDGASSGSCASRHGQYADGANSQGSGTGPRDTASKKNGGAAANGARNGSGAAKAKSGRDRYLGRASIRTSMRRTLSRRRRTRAAEQKAARAEAEAQAQLEVSRAVAEAATARAARARGEQRMGVPSGVFRGDPNFRAPKMSMNGGYPRGPGDDEDGDDLDTGRQKRFFLALDDDIVQAPSIGPRTAERLRANGIATVRDLLANKAAAISTRLATRHITTEKIASWQHQARLVCTIPWLRGTHAQILVGSGYYAPHSLVTANRDALCTAILRFATTREGQSVLRSAPPPSLGKIMGWVEQAGMAELDRATVVVLTQEKATAAA